MYTHMYMYMYMYLYMYIYIYVNISGANAIAGFAGRLRSANALPLVGCGHAGTNRCATRASTGVPAQGHRRTCTAVVAHRIR